MRTKMNSSSPVAAKKRTCTWRWPPCDKWMQKNDNRLCSAHNTRYIAGERPIDPTAVAAPDTAATVHHTATTPTTPADTTPTANTKRKKKE